MGSMRHDRATMDALMAALVLGAICQIGDKTPWLAAILSDRFRAPTVVIGASVLALALNYALGVAGGLLIAPLTTPEARLALLALALVFAGVTTAIGTKSPDRLEGWRLGPFGTSAAGLAIMVFGDRMQFIVVALATRSELPWLAAVGATIGASAVTIPAVLIGERQWLALPQRALRIATAIFLTATGIYLGLMAVRLI